MPPLSTHEPTPATKDRRRERREPVHFLGARRRTKRRHFRRLCYSVPFPQTLRLLQSSPACLLGDTGTFPCSLPANRVRRTIPTPTLHLMNRFKPCFVLSCSALVSSHQSRPPVERNLTHRAQRLPPPCAHPGRIRLAAAPSPRFSQGLRGRSHVSDWRNRQPCERQLHLHKIQPPDGLVNHGAQDKAST